MEVNVRDVFKKLDKLKAELDALRPLNAETNTRLEQKLNIELTWNSNAIEGNTLTLGETKTFLLYGITAKEKPFRDYIDIAGHKEALDYVENAVIRGDALTQSFCRFLHKILLGEKTFRIKAVTQEGMATTREIRSGEYKQQANSVLTSTGEIFYYTAPNELYSCMTDLFDWYNKQLVGTAHGIKVACEFHYRFVRIHPFDDGNGRMARLLMKKRNEYIASLESANASGEIADFIEFIAN